MNVLCNCGSYHETTEAFDPDKRPHGGMFRLKDPYRSNGWSSFPEHEGVTGDALECPQCGSPYGYPVRVDGEGTEDLIREKIKEAEDRLRKEGGELVYGDAMPTTASGIAARHAHLGPYGGDRPDDSDIRIIEMYREGKRPKEIAQELGLSSHMKVVARLKAMGEK